MTEKSHDAASSREDSFLGELIPHAAEHLAEQHTENFDAEAGRTRFLTWLDANTATSGSLEKVGRTAPMAPDPNSWDMPPEQSHGHVYSARWWRALRKRLPSRVRTPGIRLSMPPVPVLEMPALPDTRHPSETFTLETPALGDAFNFLVRVRCSWHVQAAAADEEIRAFIEENRTVIRDRIEEKLRPILSEFPPYQASEAEKKLNLELGSGLELDDAELRVTVRAWVDVCDTIREDLRRVWQRHLEEDAEGGIKKVFDQRADSSKELPGDLSAHAEDERRATRAAAQAIADTSEEADETQSGFRKETGELPGGAERSPEPVMMGGIPPIEDNMDVAARVLSLAQQTADQAIADARREADDTLGRARREADEVLIRGRRQVEQITSDARARAESLERDAQERHRQAMGSLVQGREDLERRVDDLRAFEREYRSRLKAYLQGQLRDLEAGVTDSGIAPDPGSEIDDLRAFEREYRSRLKAYLEGQLRDLEAGVTDSGTFPSMGSVAQPSMAPPPLAPSGPRRGGKGLGQYGVPEITQHSGSFRTSEGAPLGERR